MTSAAPLVLVTGATDGIGRQTALELARMGAAVIVHGRRADRVEATRAALAAEAPGAVVHGALGDFASLASVRELAADVAARFPRLDVLLNNAGVYMKEKRLSADGFEMTMAVNHLAPFLLTHLLMPRLAAARGRVVNVSSVAHTRGRLELDNLQAEKGFHDYEAYARSKLANVLFTVELARRVRDTGVTANALHPGVVSTKLLTEGFEMRGPDSLEQGAATSVYLATSPDVAAVTGEYFAAKRPAATHPAARDAALCARFYDHSAKLVGL